MYKLISKETLHKKPTCNVLLVYADNSSGNGAFNFMSVIGGDRSVSNNMTSCFYEDIRFVFTSISIYFDMIIAVHLMQDPLVFIISNDQASFDKTNRKVQEIAKEKLKKEVATSFIQSINSSSNLNASEETNAAFVFYFNDKHKKTGNETDVHKIITFVRATFFSIPSKAQEMYQNPHTYVLIQNMMNLEEKLYKDPEIFLWQARVSGLFLNQVDFTDSTLYYDPIVVLYSDDKFGVIVGKEIYTYEKAYPAEIKLMIPQPASKPNTLNTQFSFWHSLLSLGQNITNNNNSSNNNTTNVENLTHSAITNTML